MKKTLRFTSAALTLALAAGMALPAFAAAKPSFSKDETVYAVMAPDGSVTSTTVSAHLYNAAGLSGVTDRSTLTDIVNTESDAPFTQNGDSLTWDTTDTDVYYKGNTSRALPVSAAVTYTLDGETAPLENLLGKSGHLTIRIDLTNNETGTVTVNGAERTVVTPFITAVGVVLGVNTRPTGAVLGQEYRTLWGADVLTDTLCGLTFRLSVPSFYQVNREMAEVLYRRAVEFAGLTGTETVLDLYCGAGTITQVMARRAARVIGAEIVPEAIEDARANAQRNGVENVEFFCGDAAAAAADFARRGLRPDVICVDPPRKGLAPEVVHAAAQMAPKRIVYVSCDPATLARDVKLLAQEGYRAIRAAAVDMFPGTANVETVRLLSKLKSKEHIEIEVKMDEMDLTSAESKATYEEIREYVLEHTGLKVSHLYIAQVKQKYGIIERENYNKPKSEDARQPQCPLEKERAITEALKHFGML